MKRAAVLAPEDTRTGVAAHHQNGVAIVSVDCVLRDRAEERNVFFVEGTHGVNVTTAEPVAGALEPSPGPAKQRLASGSTTHRGSSCGSVAK